MKTMKWIAASALLMGASAVFAHGNIDHGKTAAGAAATAPEQMPWGMAASAQAVTRTITVRMTDDMRFAPSQITVKQGEAVRLRVENRGQILHEMVLGTPDTLDAHAQMMLKFPGMEHDAPYMAHVAPQQSGDLTWQFNRAGRFDFACLIAGHYQAGMRGTITVTP